MNSHFSKLLLIGIVIVSSSLHAKNKTCDIKMPLSDKDRQFAIRDLAKNYKKTIRENAPTNQLESTDFTRSLAKGADMDDLTKGLRESVRSLRQHIDLPSFRNQQRIVNARNARQGVGRLQWLWNEVRYRLDPRASSNQRAFATAVAVGVPALVFGAGGAVGTGYDIYQTGYSDTMGPFITGGSVTVGTAILGTALYRARSRFSKDLLLNIGKTLNPLDYCRMLRLSYENSKSDALKVLKGKNLDIFFDELSKGENALFVPENNRRAFLFAAEIGYPMNAETFDSKKGLDRELDSLFTYLHHLEQDLAGETETDQLPRKLQSAFKRLRLISDESDPTSSERDMIRIIKELQEARKEAQTVVNTATKDLPLEKRKEFKKRYNQHASMSPIYFYEDTSFGDPEMENLFNPKDASSAELLGHTYSEERDLLYRLRRYAEAEDLKLSYQFKLKEDEDIARAGVLKHMKGEFTVKVINKEGGKVSGQKTIKLKIPFSFYSSSTDPAKMTSLDFFEMNRELIQGIHKKIYKGRSAPAMIVQELEVMNGYEKILLDADSNLADAALLIDPDSDVWVRESGEVADDVIDLKHMTLKGASTIQIEAIVGKICSDAKLQVQKAAELKVHQ